MLCGLLTPDGGSGTCLGFDILSEAAAIKRQVGYMTQRFCFYEDLTSRENLDFVARMYGVPQRRQAVDARARAARARRARRQLAGTLSGGWKQRLALAACMLHEPQLLLLDEPTAGVDPKARREFWEEIHALAADGITVLVTTHYMDEAERCHRLAYIAYGRLLAQGTVEEVIGGSAPDHLDGHRRAARRGWPSALARPAGRRAGGARSATRCTSAAPIAALLERSIAACARPIPALRWQPGRALARGRVHPSDGAARSSVA